jgi:hypothetical protein
MEHPLTPFEPAVPANHRRDGWTAEKQIAFVEALAETACVADACRRVGMSESSAYRLRHRPCGAPFRRAWDAALDCALHRLEAAAVSRALNGVARPIFYQGEQVGEYREFDERLTMFLLRYCRPQRFGGWIDRTLAPELAQEGVESDPALRLDGSLDCIEHSAADDGEDPPPAMEP